MINAERGFLAAIARDPKDTVHRAAYLDWLDEQEPGVVPCPGCDGSGWRRNHTHVLNRDHECPTCNGTGTVRDERHRLRAELIRIQIERVRRDEPLFGADVTSRILNLHGAEWSRVACPTCRGQGKGHYGLEDTYWECEQCHGTGDAMHNRNPQWSRGFVYSVECRMEEVGREVECENCGGDGEFTRRNSDGPPGPCPECGGWWDSGPHFDADDYWSRGTGRVFRPAPWLAAVFQNHPIERVIVTDREPYYMGEDWAYYTTRQSQLIPSVSILPEWLVPSDSPYKIFKTVDLANTWLATRVADIVRSKI